MESIERAQTYYRDEGHLLAMLMRLRREADEWREELDDEPPTLKPSQELRSIAPVAIEAICDDVDG